MIKAYVKFIFTFLFFGSFVAGFYFETEIQQHYPTFSASLYLAAVIFLISFVYAMVMRNMTIGVIGIIASISMPWLVRLFLEYLPFVTYQIALWSK